jgi:excinuclease UvrABC nuclease subunit
MTLMEEVEQAVAEYRKIYNLELVPTESYGDYSPGCYALYGANLLVNTSLKEPFHLLYIGKAPRGLKTRLDAHKRYWQQRVEGGSRLIAGWGRNIVWEKTQRFRVAHWWEASSLEDFLINKFQPRYNQHYKDRPA